MSVNETTGLSYRPFSPRFGAELTDSVLLNFDDDEVEALQQLAAERGVVVARNQTMTLQQQSGFARRLGPLTRYPVRDKGVPPELLMVHADGTSKHVAGSKWHTDISSEERPPSLSMLRMEVVPSSGGDTLFCDMYQAFASLSPEMQRFLMRLSARHDPKGHHLYLSGMKTLKELPSQIHPVIRTHPRTGRNALYVNAGFTARIQDVTRSESDALLAMLFDHIVQGLSFQIRVHWEPDTVVFWDNRVVQHHAAWDYYPEVRHGYRATSIGEIPYLADPTEADLP